MQPLLILAIVAALAIAEWSPAAPAGGVLFRTALTAAGAVLVVVTASLAARLMSWRLRTLMAEGAAADRWQQQFRLLHRWQTVHAALWLAVGLATMLLGWPQVVRQDWHLGQAVLVDELLILLPLLATLVLSWAAWAEVEQTVGTLCGVARRTGRWASTWFHCRHDLLLVLGPVVVVLGAQDLAARYAPATSPAEVSLVALMPLLALLVLLLPVALRRIWNTEPLPAGELRCALAEESRRRRASVREVFLWRTDDRIVNAAVTGVIARLRYVFLSDGLLNRLSTAETLAIYAHELGHIRHHHLAWRLAALLLPAAGYSIVARVTSFDTLRPIGTHATAMYAAGPAVSWTVASIALLVYMATMFGRYCRLLEQQADRFAAQSADGVLSARRTQTFARALRRVAAANGSEGRLARWLHPSVPERICHLARLADDPRAQQRAKSELWRAHALLVSLLLLGVAAAIL